MAASVAEGSVAPVVSPPAGGAPSTYDVRTAIRLGWFLAEVRGRHWWRGQRPPVLAVPVDPPYALPLRPERTVAESRGAARDAAAALAEQLGVARRFGDPPEGPSYPDRLRLLAGPLEADGGTLLSPPAGTPTEAAVREREAAWAEVASLMHDWDCAIQDRLGARSDTLCNAYLLGRGMSECYWALIADDEVADGPASAASWQFLLGPDRVHELSRLLARVAPNLPALTPTAAAGSLQAWSDVAADPAWRGRDGRPRLFEQYRQWYELLVLGREPTTYVRPYALLRGWRTTLRAFRAFWPQLLLAAASAVAVSAVAYFLATRQGSALLTTMLGLFGAVGLTSAGLVAKAKSTGQQLLMRLRQDVYGDLVSVAVTTVPALPGTGRGRRGSRLTERRVRACVRRRPVTPITPPPDGSGSVV